MIGWNGASQNEDENAISGSPSMKKVIFKNRIGDSKENADMRFKANGSSAVSSLAHCDVFVPVEHNRITWLAFKIHKFLFAEILKIFAEFSFALFLNRLSSF